MEAIEAAAREAAHNRVPLLQSPAAAQPRPKHRPMRCQSTPLPLLHCRPQPRESLLTCLWMPCGPLAPLPALMQHASLGLLFRLTSACVGHASHRRQVSAPPDCASSWASWRIVCSSTQWMRSGCKLDCNRLGDQKLRLTSGFHRSLSLMIKGLGLRAAQELC